MNFSASKNNSVDNQNTAESHFLKLSNLLGSGNERHCWEHPTNPKLCIKTLRPGVHGRHQNELELEYYQLLESRNIAGPHIPKFYGWVDTNQGKGLLLERVIWERYNTSISLRQAIQKGLLSPDQGKKLASEAFSWFIHHSIIISDYNADHFLIKEAPNNKLCLVVVDGLGGRHRGFKRWLRQFIPLLARFKTKKLFAEVISRTIEGQPKRPRKSNVEKQPLQR